MYGKCHAWLWTRGHHTRGLAAVHVFALEWPRFPKYCYDKSTDTWRALKSTWLKHWKSSRARQRAHCAITWCNLKPPSQHAGASSAPEALSSQGTHVKLLIDILERAFLDVNGPNVTIGPVGRWRPVSQQASSRPRAGGYHGPTTSTGYRTKFSNMLLAPVLVKCVRSCLRDLGPSCLTMPARALTTPV